MEATRSSETSELTLYGVKNQTIILEIQKYLMWKKANNMGHINVTCVKVHIAIL
jgi:hypothetical protein